MAYALLPLCKVLEDGSWTIQGVVTMWALCLIIDLLWWLR
jgi:hypothetical protein